MLDPCDRLCKDIRLLLVVQILVSGRTQMRNVLVRRLRRRPNFLIVSGLRRDGIRLIVLFAKPMRCIVKRIVGTEVLLWITHANSTFYSVEPAPRVKQHLPRRLGLQHPTPRDFRSRLRPGFRSEPRSHEFQLNRQRLMRSCMPHQSQRLRHPVRIHVAE